MRASQALSEARTLAESWRATAEQMLLYVRSVGAQAAKVGRCVISMYVGFPIHVLMLLLPDTSKR